MYLSKTYTVLCTRRFRSSPRFTAVVPILRISKAISWIIPLSLSCTASLQPSRQFCVVLSPCLPARRLLHCAFALEVISKNFWRWIVPRDGNRGPTLPAAFTQTTGETTFPSVRVTLLFGSQSAGEIMLRTVVTFSLSSLSPLWRKRASSVAWVRLGANEILSHLMAR